MTLTQVSLFSGVGGFDLAGDRAGITPAAMCEIDKSCQSVLKAHWPDVPLFTDVKEVTGDSLRGLGIDPDRTVLTGGFPCQDVSVAGLRAGLAGARTGLFWEVIRILKEFQPAYFVLENVPGLLTSNRGRDMGTVLWALEECGYHDLAYRILDAQHFGVPQRRRRVFIVGHLGSTYAWAGEVLAITQGSKRDSDPSDAAGEDVARTFEPSVA
jgi:DNA (cytosine-5)-methyltransferase 1